MTPFELEETQPGVFAVRFYGDRSNAFGVDAPPEGQTLADTGLGPRLTRNDGCPDACVMLVSLPEAFAYAHQLGKQIGFGDFVHAYCRVLPLSCGPTPYRRGKHQAMNAIRAAKVHVGVGDVVRWGRHGVGRVKAIEEGRVATVKVRGSDAQVPVPIYDLHVIVPAAKGTST